MRILLTGRPGIGKTTVVRRVIEQYSRPCAGFYTKAIEQEGHRLGFQICTLTGERGLLAHIGFKDGPRVGRYRVNVAEFERIALPALLPPTETTLVIIDEIGKMECFSPRFRKQLESIFERPNPLLGTIPHRETPLIRCLEKHSEVELMKVTKANRDELPTLLLHQLMETKR